MKTRKVLPASGIALEVTLPGSPGNPDAAVLVGDARVVFEGELGPDALGEGEPFDILAAAPLALPL